MSIRRIYRKIRITGAYFLHAGTLYKIDIEKHTYYVYNKIDLRCIMPEAIFVL